MMKDVQIKNRIYFNQKKNAIKNVIFFRVGVLKSFLKKQHIRKQINEKVKWCKPHAKDTRGLKRCNYFIFIFDPIRLSSRKKLKLNIWRIFLICTFSKRLTNKSSLLNLFISSIHFVFLSWGLGLTKLMCLIITHFKCFYYLKFVDIKFYSHTRYLFNRYIVLY